MLVKLEAEFKSKGETLLQEASDASVAAALLWQEVT